LSLGVETSERSDAKRSGSPSCRDGPLSDGEEAVEIPIDGDLDLHPFAPRDIPSVVEEYVRACHERGITRLRLAHGKGKGVQRAVVRRVLASLPEVSSFGDADLTAGAWGATSVVLHPRENPDEN
jgi:DNA-nicking Smr family endonuclease